LIEFVDAKYCDDLSTWLKRLEYLKYRKVQVLIVKNYHQLLLEYPLVDELICDWFPQVIGYSDHFCRGKANVFFWNNSVLTYEQIYPVIIGVPKKYFGKFLSSVVAKRYGALVFLESHSFCLPNGWGRAWKTLLYWIFFVIFDLNHANQSSRPSFKQTTLSGKSPVMSYPSS
jgi:hypothetical protein